MANRVRLGLLAASGVLMLLTVYMAFLYAPREAVMGDVQRIFYFHVPIAIGSFVAFGVVSMGSLIYLIKKSDQWDALAYSGAEVGMIFVSLMLVTGMLWGKPTWGVWWDWTPQLTTSLILWFIYAGYLMLRAYAPRGPSGKRYAAILGVLGIIDIPVIYMATIFWRDLHPEKVVGPAAEEGALAPEMLTTFMVAMVAFMAFLAYLIAERYALRRAEDDIERMQLAYGKS
jgi:heme exporter protein C